MTTIRIADWSMYQCVYHGDPHNFDQLYDPAYWTVIVDWAKVKAAVAGVIIRAGIGTRKDPCFDRLLAGLKAAGIPWGIYHAFDPSADPVHQAQLVRQWCPETPPLGVWGDIEMGTARAAVTMVYLAALDQAFGLTAGIYSGGPYLDNHFTAAQQHELESRLLWIAGYPNFWPAYGWSKGANHALHQYTDAYQLPGLAQACDMSVPGPAYPWSANPMPEPETITGCLIGAGAESNNDARPIYATLAAVGAVPPIGIAVHNPGLCVEWKALGVRTTIARFMHPVEGNDHDFEAGGSGRGGWSADKRLRFARASIALAFDHMNPTEAAAVDFVQCAGNEWDAQDVGEWLATCDVWMLVLDERDNRNAEYIRKNGKPLKLAMGIFNAGTPKTWPMYQAIFSHPVFGRMHAAGDFLGFHEGVGFGQPFDYLANVRLEGAPTIDDAGLMNFRSDYALHVLDSHGWAMAYGFLEEYDGFTRNDEDDPRIAYLQALDQHMGRRGPRTRRFFRGGCAFEVTNDPASSWYRQDFTHVLEDPKWIAYAASQKGRINGTGDDDMQPLYHVQAAQDLAIRDLSGNPITDPAGDPPAQPGLAGVVRAGTTLHVYQVGVSLPTGLKDRVVINPNGANVWGVPAAVKRV